MNERPAGPDSRQAIDAQASEFVARLQGEVSASERQTIYDWIAADPHHAVAFARMEAAWEASARLVADPPSIEAAVAAKTPGWPSPLISRRNIVAAAVAASTVGVMATASWRYLSDVQLYRTKVGERRTVVLADGSSVRLNTASTIEVAMSEEERRVRLVKGEALFEVAHDTQRPFLVDARSAQMRAVGTAFNVRIRENVVELTVTEGVVVVDQDGDAASNVEAPRIAAGGGAVIRSNAVAPTLLDGQVLRQRTAWQEGVIELEGETLPQAVEEFNRYRSSPIIVGDARLANIRVGGRFEVDEADKFLTALANSFPVEVIPSADGSVLLVARQ